MGDGLGSDFGATLFEMTSNQKSTKKKGRVKGKSIKKSDVLHEYHDICIVHIFYICICYTLVRELTTKFHRLKSAGWWVGDVYICVYLSQGVFSLGLRTKTHNFLGARFHSKEVRCFFYTEGRWIFNIKRNGRPAGPGQCGESENLQHFLKNRHIMLKV